MSASKLPAFPEKQLAIRSNPGTDGYCLRTGKVCKHTKTNQLKGVRQVSIRFCRVSILGQQHYTANNWEDAS